jgi:hypothetical protein
VYGTKSEEIIQKYKNHPAVTVKTSLPYPEIGAMDINVASLLPEWNHVCVPSKTVTAICCGSPVLLNISEEADNWKMFNQAGWRIPPSSKYTTLISEFLGELTRASIQVKRNEAIRLARECVRLKEKAMDDIKGFIVSSGPSA